MKIAFSSEENKGLESQMSPHFGRCPYYVFVELDNENNVTSVATEENPFFQSHQPGAVPNYIADKKVNVMIAGGMGPRAMEFFNQLGVEAVTGASGTVKEALSQYLGGTLKGSKPCAEGEEHSHHYN